MGRPTELKVNTLTPATKNKRISIAAQSIVLKNTGSTNITINKHWTLIPGETTSLGVSSDNDEILIWDLNIVFENGEGRLEMLEVVSNKPIFTNYKRN